MLLHCRLTARAGAAIAIVVDFCPRKFFTYEYKIYKLIFKRRLHFSFFSVFVFPFVRLALLT